MNSEIWIHLNLKNKIILQKTKLVTIDFFLTISSLPSGSLYAFVFVNHFTKFVVVVPTKDQMAPTTAKLFWMWPNPMGAPNGYSQTKAQTLSQ